MQRTSDKITEMNSGFSSEKLFSKNGELYQNKPIIEAPIKKTKLRKREIKRRHKEDPIK